MEGSKLEAPRGHANGQSEGLDFGCSALTGHICDELAGHHRDTLIQAPVFIVPRS